MRPLNRVGSLKRKLGIVIVLATAAGIVAFVAARRAGLPGLASLPVGLGAGLSLTHLLARGMTRPLRDMAAAARAMAAGDYRQRIASSAADEVGMLARAFNAMADELETTDQLRRELVANASHELRTPLTALRARLENVIDNVEPADRDTLGAMLGQVDRLAGLVAQLLDLSRLESGTERLDRTPVVVADLLDGVARDAQVASRSVTITVEGQRDGPVVDGDPERLRQLLTNLVANAVRHSPPGGRVVLASRLVAGAAVIEVVDDGVGIPREEASRVFERFYRLDTARTIDDGGAGLGLAIARWIVELHDGTIATEPLRPGSPMPGCRMTVTIPGASRCA